jgi:PAS domain-containing protein
MLFTSVDALLERIEQRLLSEPERSGEAEELSMSFEALRVMREELGLRADAMAEDWQRYADFFRYAPEAYMITSDEGVIENANARAAALLRCDPRELYGQQLTAFVHESDRRPFFDRLAMLRLQPVPDDERTGFHDRLMAMGVSGIAGEESWHATLQPRRGRSVVSLCSARTAPTLGRKLLFWTFRPEPPAD